METYLGMPSLFHVSTVHTKELSQVFLQGGTGRSALGEQGSKDVSKHREAHPVTYGKSLHK